MCEVALGLGRAGDQNPQASLARRGRFLILSVLCFEGFSELGRKRVRRLASQRPWWREGESRKEWHGRWQPRPAKMRIRAPQLDIRRVRCLTLGDVRIETSAGWSG